MESLTKLTLDDFSALLGSDAPAPGGGSAAAYQGALGAALTAMVCALTQKKFAEFAERAENIRCRAEELRRELLALTQEDTDSFCAVSAAYAMPKATPEEKAQRKTAIQCAMQRCIEVPQRVMELSGQALELTAELLQGFNTNAASDLGCAALSLRSAILGAWLNVRINTGSMADQTLAAQYRQEGQALLDRLLPLADRIYNAICEMT